ncbi:MAG TPA: nucleotidyltransferase domain-containing protein [Methanocorpusculum sp.]|nr:nucleotidyltransferase domain-containing protein [Methanocorpusculum sp.]
MSVYQSIRTLVLSRLEDALPTLQERFGVETIGLFGSVARGDENEQSDINILYLFAEDRGNLSEFIGLQEYLEELFGREVHMVSIEYLNDDLRPYVKKDARLFGLQQELI